MNIDNKLHSIILERIQSDSSFHILCGLAGIALYSITFYIVYVCFIKVYPYEQDQFYLKKTSKKYYCEYDCTIHKFNKIIVLRFALPDKYEHTGLGADMQEIELFFDDGNGDLMRLAGVMEALVYYPLGAISQKGEFDVAVHEDSPIYRMLYNQKPGFPMKVKGPRGNNKYLGDSTFYDVVNQAVTKYACIVMITEDDKIFNIIKLLRTKVDKKEDSSNFVLLHRAVDYQNIFIEEELKFWQENDMLRVTVSVEKAAVLPVVDKSKGEAEQVPILSQILGEKYAGLKGVIEGESERFSSNFLELGLPMPTDSDDVLVIISLKETRRNMQGGGGKDQDELEYRIEKLGFNNIMML